MRDRSIDWLIDWLYGVKRCTYLTSVHYFDNGYVGKAANALERYSAEYW